MDKLIHFCALWFAIFSSLSVWVCKDDKETAHWLIAFFAFVSATSWAIYFTF